MSIENLSIEELYKEIEARKAAAQAELRRELDEARKKVRELEAKLGESDKALVKAPKSQKSKLSMGEKTERILAALDGTGFLSANDITAKVGFDGNSLRDALHSLTQEGKLVREGKARGSKYRLA
jgi:predicted HTH transcriptional regulator